MIFKHKLNHDLLATALKICQNNPSVVYNSSLKDKYDLKIGFVRLNKHLSIRYSSDRIMFVDTYVDNIHMASYVFWKFYKDFDGWVLKTSNIQHAMPKSFIVDMNTFSKEVVSLYQIRLKEERRKEKIKEKEFYEKEKRILEKYK